MPHGPGQKKEKGKKKDVYVQIVTDTLVKLEKDWKTGKSLIMYQLGGLKDGTFIIWNTV